MMSEAKDYLSDDHFVLINMGEHEHHWVIFESQEGNRIYVTDPYDGIIIPIRQENIENSENIDTENVIIYHE